MKATPNHKRQDEDKYFILKSIVSKVEKATSKSLDQLKEHYKEEQLFALALFHVTTTKKALCTALSIPVEAGCRYKRELEKNGNLAQSKDEVLCPFTRHPAHLISTNPQEFERLLETSSNQLTLF